LGISTKFLHYKKEVKMGLMDFIRKKSDADMGLESSGLDSDPLAGSNPTLNLNSGMEFQHDQSMNPSMSMSSMGSSAFGQPMQQSMPQSNDMQKDIQMISLKLDAIKSELDAVNQRLRNLESIAEREQFKTTNKKWY
jgi:hypothetical protein